MEEGVETGEIPHRQVRNFSCFVGETRECGLPLMRGGLSFAWGSCKLLQKEQSKSVRARTWGTCSPTLYRAEGSKMVDGGVGSVSVERTDHGTDGGQITT